LAMVSRGLVDPGLGGVPKTEHALHPAASGLEPASQTARVSLVRLYQNHRAEASSAAPI
jgi:hypothetical protein